MIQTVQQTQQTQPTGPGGMPALLASGYGRVAIMVTLLVILYLRVYRKKESQGKVCPHCGQRNPAHHTHCMRCSGPLW